GFLDIIKDTGKEFAVKILNNLKCKLAGGCPP
nr:Chain A, Palustrin-Ca antimicrobial peptide [Aquarana catesbeiana]